MPERRPVVYPVDLHRALIPTRSVRLRAWLADCAIVALLLWLPAALLLLPPGLSLAAPRALFFLGVLWSLVAVPYHVLHEGLAGQTPGKRRLGLAVVALEPGEAGQRPGLRRALLRVLLRYVDGLAFGLLGLAVSSARRDGRRVGDLLAGTLVVRVEDDPPGSARWRSGPLEEAARALREEVLPLRSSGWRVFTGVRHPVFGNLDCLLIGPPAVFVVDAEDRPGVVSRDPDSGVLLRDGRPFEQDLDDRLVRQVQHVEGSLFGTPECPLWSIVCFTRAELRQNTLGDPPRGAFRVEGLRALLEAEPMRLTPEEVDRLTRVAARAYRAPEDVGEARGPGSPGGVRW